MTVKKLYVVGSGAMGSGIAQTAATHGIQVIMNDINEEFVAKGYNKIKKSLEKAVSDNQEERISPRVCQRSIRFGKLLCLLLSVIRLPVGTDRREFHLPR